MSERELNTEANSSTVETGSGLGSTRRKFLATGTASWASVSLAGCVGGEADDDDHADENNDAPNFVVTDEIIAGSEGIPPGAGGFVSAGKAQRTFAPGMQAIFKVGVWDPASGDIVSDEALDEARVELDRDIDVDLEFNRDEREWSGDWMIPEDAETGTVGYDVVVSNDAVFTDVGIAENEFEIFEFEPAAANYVVTDDTYAVDDRGGGWVQSCLPQHNFTSDMAIGFDIGIYDGGTGDPVGPDVVDEAVIDFEAGDPDEVDLEWDEEDEIWGYTWRGVPADHEGTLEYEVQVTNDGEFHNVGVYQGSVEIIPEPATDGEDPAANYVVTDDTYAIEDRVGGFVQSCLPQHNFTPEMGVGFDIGIYDARTGNPVGPDVVDEAVIDFEAGDPDEVDLEWDDEDEIWGYTWRGIPDGYEGTLSYEVQVTNDGEFHRVGVYQDSIEVIADPGLD